MWTPQNRKRYDRSRLRYPSDLTDEEWAHIAPLIPPAKPGGNKRMVDVREVMNGVMYVLSTGCQWRALPKDLPPKSTVHDYFGHLEKFLSPSRHESDSVTARGNGRMERAGHGAKRFFRC
jgi:transposase